MLDRYRESSMVVGKDVTICTEHSDRTLQVVARGRVATLGENLELILEGQPEPITGGRLIMGAETKGDGDRRTEADSAPLAFDDRDT